MLLFLPVDQVALRIWSISSVFPYVTCLLEFTFSYSCFGEGGIGSRFLYCYKLYPFKLVKNT